MGVLLLVFMVACVLGVIGYQRISARIDSLERELRVLHYRARSQSTQAPAAVDLESPPVPREPKADTATAQIPPPPPPAPRSYSSPSPFREPPPNLAWKKIEATVVNNWMAWTGGLMIVIGVAFFLKYAYDNNWIDERGRLAVGVLTGAAALAVGEKLRRTEYYALFQTISGVGIAILYACVFFSFQVYHLSGPTLSFLFAILITAGAVVLAVAHDALAIAVLALIGGFLSPVLLSTGENHPYILFSYITVLDLVALGVAYFKRWRGLDLLAFAGTVLLYQGWYAEYYEDDQLVPALLFTTMFYLLFLLIPVFHSLVRRIPERWDGLTLVAANAAYSLMAYYQVLYEDQRMALGFVALGQALLVFLLARAWAARVGKDTLTSEGLLIIAMALMTLAIPLELRLYGIPIAWAVEGLLFAYIGARYDRWTVQLAAVAALFLAAAGLLHRLPLHRLPFTPILNVPFGSWMVVIGCAMGCAWVLRASGVLSSTSPVTAPPLAVVSGFLAYALACLLLTLETMAFWDTSDYPNRVAHWFSSQVVLWAVIAAATAYGVLRWRSWALLALVYLAFGVGALFFFTGLAHHDVPSHILLFNTSFLPKLALIIAAWWAGGRLGRGEGRIDGHVLAIAGHGMLAILLAVELERWAGAANIVSDKMAFGLLSAVWAAQALALVWLGLIWRDKLRRGVGLALFGIVVLKVFIFDTAELREVYRILSFILSGFILLLATYLYHRFSKQLLAEGREEGPAL